MPVLSPLLFRKLRSVSKIHLFINLVSPMCSVTGQMALMKRWIDENEEEEEVQMKKSPAVLSWRVMKHQPGKLRFTRRQLLRLCLNTVGREQTSFCDAKVKQTRATMILVFERMIKLCGHLYKLRERDRSWNDLKYCRVLEPSYTKSCSRTFKCCTSVE